MSDREKQPLPAVSRHDDATLLGAAGMGPPRAVGTMGSLPGFDVLKVIGAGGMGVVLLARELASGDLVAVKIIRPELAHLRNVVHRFLVEARHLSRLQHPNIIQVRGISDSESCAFYSMPYFSRGALSRHIDPNAGLPKESILRYAIPSAEAIAFAHDRGIIHRDVKPANILLGDDDLPYVCDFGLVRTVFNDSIVDPSRDVNEGSAPYMSPALANGRVEDTRCDIYAFGATLYEMLTGRPPYSGRSSEDVLRRIREGPPDPVTKINPAADAGLAAIAERCMGRELRDRYSSLHDVVLDLKRVNAGEWPTLRIRPARKTTVRVLICVAVLGIAALMVVALRLWHPPSKLTETSATTPVCYSAVDSFTRNPGEHFSFGTKGVPGGAFTLLGDFGTEPNGLPKWFGANVSAYVVKNPFASIANIGPSRAMPGQIVLHPGRLGELPCVRFICPQDGLYNVLVETTTMGLENRGQMVWSIVVNDRLLLMGGVAEANAGTFPFARSVELRKGDHLDLVCDPAGSSDSDFLNVDFKLIPVDRALPTTQPLPMPLTQVPAKTLKEIARVALPRESHLTSLGFSDDGRGVVAGTSTGGILIWSVDQLRPLRTIQFGTLPIRWTQLPDVDRGSMLVQQGDRNGSLKIVDSTNANQLRDLRAASVDRLLADGQQVLTSRSAGGQTVIQLVDAKQQDDQIQVWSTILDGPDADLIGVVPFGDGSNVLVADEGGSVYILRLSDGAVVRKYQIDGLRPPIAIGARGRLLLGSVGGLIRAFRITDGTAVQQLGGHVWPVDQLRIDPATFVVRSIDTSGQMYIWDLSTGARTGQIEFPPAAESGIAISPDGMLAAQVVNGELHLSRVPGND